ncbi:type IV pilus assembly protein PilF [Modicisalibacter ilicicola DSM 19980]|uniref:Type IV pilus assembly protein PilF n=1 Tax=Modicisalibacter ilicicola DSM 19980 TaxID=1121942 RepID=A0A1M4T9I9_9GAMM|nr:type IV pilus biogenesis/stability protein PilW [Halomonas ilicicola]SHE41070.1 type IV pilus assembly protein PilF [Halomonas ilicicola DSM 19980]
MSQPHRSSLPVRLSAALFAVAWLSGCATPTPDGDRQPVDLDQALTLNVTMGIEYMEQGNLARAQSKIDRALEIEPDSPQALHAQALIYQRQGESQMADRFFRRALSIAPDFTRGRNNYAAFLYSRGRIEESCAQLERASQDIKYNNRAQLFTNLGQCQWELGDVSNARASLNRAQAIDPRTARSHLILARIDHAEGNPDRAWEQLQSFIRLAGTTPESLRLAAQLARARGDDAAAAFYSRQIEARDAP